MLSCGFFTWIKLAQSLKIEPPASPMARPARPAKEIFMMAAPPI
jgi:hypothetical protein